MSPINRFRTSKYKLFNFTNSPPSFKRSYRLGVPTRSSLQYTNCPFLKPSRIEFRIRQLLLEIWVFSSNFCNCSSKCFSSACNWSWKRATWESTDQSLKEDSHSEATKRHPMAKANTSQNFLILFLIPDLLMMIRFSFQYCHCPV